ncbi:Putative ABC transporter, ATPase [Septoria linicola]|uniref:ABC transporter, ATPase n=1 Tax=Septoria linicola TaxID=215465 RepID=A0A9Q9ENG2_9PEZI|nr:putative ABC transporter, ATPase [Septoria linicola]USW56549.1 Putative ABC transporter, ATPase [Septoria linicola]
MSGRGRGAYYRNLYGGRGRGRGSRNNNAAGDDGPAQQNSHEQGAISGEPKSWQQLQHDLRSIDSQQYGAYKRLYGKYTHVGPRFTLSFDHIQGDSYAAPSRVRSIVPWLETGLPSEYLESDIRRIALCDFVSRVAGSIIQSRHLNENVGNGSGGWSGPKGGAFSICIGGQEILPRTSALITGRETIELRFTVALPAAGRSVLGQQAWQILGINLVDVVKQSLLLTNLDSKRLKKHVSSAEVQHSLRAQLRDRGLVSFIANGAILPRTSGAAQTPMSGAAVVPFQSPNECEVSLVDCNGKSHTGMGVPCGVTLLTGGGFHGKSTLLEAIELGIYNHVPGDGRELVVTDANSVKIRAEDGRSVCKTDISPYISQLPGGKDTTAFASEDASGSTSMAANIQEALEADCKALLIDEDSSATNLLVRDRRMEVLIRNEPITPLITKVRALYKRYGVSTVIVIGGLGDWLSVADTIIALDSYRPRYINSEVEKVLRQYPSSVTEDADYGTIPRRAFRVDLEGLRSPAAMRKKFITMSPQVKDAVDDPSRAESGIDLSGLDQIVEIGQSRSIAQLLLRVATLTGSEALSLAELVDRLDDCVGIHKPLPSKLVGGDQVAVRHFELGATLSRLRGLALRVDRAS